MQLDRDQAEALVAEAEQAFAAADVERIIAGYTDDVLIQFADLPDVRGKDEARRFLQARFARQRDYQLRKRLRALDGEIVGNFWEGTWTDAQTGVVMYGRGTEFWTIRDGLVAVWEATFNVRPLDGEPTTPIV